MSWFFDSWGAVLRVAVVAVFAYAAILALLRIGGNRTLAKTAAFDQVVSVALGSTLATIILAKDTSLADGATSFAMLILLQFLVATLVLKTKGIQKLIIHKPLVVLQDGALRRDVMERARLVEADVHAALRKAGVGRVEEAALVVLESDGTFSVVKKSPGAPPDAIEGIRDDLSRSPT